tara:strand:- start:330 stop:509 length:180 start_codon:yes stop_codon:yes gene_type:complete
METAHAAGMERNKTRNRDDKVLMTLKYVSQSTCSSLAKYGCFPRATRIINNSIPTNAFA